MRLFVLDTDMLTLLQHGHYEVCDNVDAHDEDDLVISVITVEEQLSGWCTVLRQAKSKEKLARAYSQLAACVESLSDCESCPSPKPASTDSSNCAPVVSKSKRQTCESPQPSWNLVGHW